jgi:hypothetical protein
MSGNANESPQMVAPIDTDTQQQEDMKEEQEEDNDLEVKNERTKGMKNKEKCDVQHL